MDQEEPMDFKTLREKFEKEEFTLKPPKNKPKPVIPEKPKVVSPPQSPTYHHLPAGARPSLLSTINDNLERKTLFAPTVVFKDSKESKTPLISTNAKGKNKREGKLKDGKDKTFKGSKENPEGSTAQKKANHKHKYKVLPLESTAELVEATPPPKVTTEKKKGLQIIKKSKRHSALISADPILDAPSSDVPGPAPLIPMPSESTTGTLHNSTPESLLPDNPTLPDHSDNVEISSPSTVLESLAFNLPPPLIPQSPEPEIPSLNSEPPPEVENPALPDSRVASQNEIIPNALSASPPPPLVCAMPVTPSVVSTPSPPPSEPEITAEAGNDAIYIPAEKKLPSSAINPPSIPPSPKAAHPVSVLSALERAEDMNHGKRAPPGDPRILNAISNARKKTTSSMTNLTQPYSVTPPPEEPSSPQSPTDSLPDLPPIDYEDRMGNALPSKAAHINGFDHQQPGPVLNEITEGCDTPPELLVVPPPPPKTIISDTRPLNSSVAEPAISTSEFNLPPHLEFTEIPAPAEFSEIYTPYDTEIGIPVSVASDGHFPELLASELENEKYTGPDVPDGQGLTKAYSNGITIPQSEIHAESPYGKISQMNPPAESSLSVGHDLPLASEPHTDDDVYQDAENVYEYVVTSEGGKKGVKTKVKKRKGQPKNPYVESTPETLQVQEKTKTGRFSKNEKKAAAEGPDEKELKKKEKQRLEKEKKELKEKQEREKKEQKEREKKENELKKKFKITGQEDALYKATVTVTTKGRKTDLPVKTGDTISIIRTGNCPRGKWLARDSSNNYGYVSVDHVELDIKEMLAMGKKTMPSSNSNLIKPSRTRTSSQVSNNYQPTEDSFTDDSEEWTGDDEPFSSPDASNPDAPLGHTRTFSVPDMGNKDLNINHQYSRSDMGADSSNNQALQKLEHFFQSQKPVESAASDTQPDISYTAGPACVLEEATHIPNKTQTSYASDSVNVAQEANHMSQTSSTENTDFAPDKIILPPPDMYADAVMVL